MLPKLNLCADREVIVEAYHNAGTTLLGYFEPVEAQSLEVVEVDNLETLIRKKPPEHISEGRVLHNRKRSVGDE
jgi:hypothetical protein